MKMMNRMRAMSLAAAAMPPKPNTAAMIATTRKMRAHLSIGVSPLPLPATTTQQRHQQGDQGTHQVDATHDQRRVDRTQGLGEGQERRGAQEAQADDCQHQDQDVQAYARYRTAHGNGSYRQPVQAGRSGERQQHRTRRPVSDGAAAATAGSPRPGRRRSRSGGAVGSCLPGARYPRGRWS